MMPVGKSVAGIALVFFLTLSAAAQDPVVSVRDDDPLMLAAFSQARASLDDFLDKWRHPQNGTRTYSVKVGLEDAGNGYAAVHANETTARTTKVEFFWVESLREDPDRFTGILSNTPSSLRNVRNGQIVQFEKQDIVDWMYLQDGKIKGNFTACPALKLASADLRRNMKEQYGLSCD